MAGMGGRKAADAGNGVLFHPATGANTALAPGQLALCGGINK